VDEWREGVPRHYDGIHRFLREGFVDRQVEMPIAARF